MGSFLASLLAMWALAIAFCDLRWRRVPNILLIAVAVPAAAALIVNHRGLLGAGIGPSLAGLALGAAPLLAGYLRRQVGAGDVKLAALLGLLLGTSGMARGLLVAGVVLGLMSAVVLLRRRYGLSGPDRLPAAPALVVGFVAIVVEQQLRWGWPGE